jgi:DMSO/TMAO reductase YedYZ molybdopterin-dependent catalytic subunit
MNGQSRALGAVLCAGAVVCCGCPGELAKPPGAGLSSGESSRKVPPVNTTLELTGSGLGKPTVFTYEQLAAMETTRLDDVTMLKTHGDDETASWQGVALAALLEAAEIKPGDMDVTLYAVDRYSMKTTLADLKDAIIALQDGQGRWLAELDNPVPLRLIPPHKPGDYWIMNLALIEVEPAKTAKP